VADVGVDRYAVSPHLTARLDVEERSGAVIHAVALRAQLMIEPQRRGYDDAETESVTEVFGGRERWAQTLRPFVWMYASTVTPGFTDNLSVDLPLPCTFDLDVVGAKYLYALDTGEVPLRFLFSGTVFSRGATGFTVEQLSWDLEAEHRMPVTTWQLLMDTFFPNFAYLRLDRETVAELLRRKAAHGMTSWDDVVRELLHRAPEPVT
jgi:hypothetical protein